MKRWMIMLCLLLGLCSLAQAEDIDQSAGDVMLAANPGHEIIAADQWGTTAAAALARGEQRVLCVAEKQGDAWMLSVNNPTALLIGQTPDILVDTDTSLYWTYTDTEPVQQGQLRFSSFKRDGVWDTVSCTVAHDSGEGTIEEATLCWRDDGVMWMLHSTCDENDNLLHQRRSAYVPAKWLAPYMPLSTYDVNQTGWPNLYYTGSWLDAGCLEKAAEELLPEYEYLGGTVDDEGLELFLRDPQGQKVLAGVTSQGVTGDWRIAISSPLPEEAFYGFENFDDYLCINDQLVSIRPFVDGSWGVDSLWPLTAEDAAVCLGQNWVASGDAGLPFRVQRAIGDHPWSDMSVINWSTLPRTLDTAVSCVDNSGWAVVNNPDPADRLHLRQKADRKAQSLGKYYNGTPVEILHRGETWTQVRILGVEGWMMTQYLAFEQAALSVASAMPDLMFRDPRGLHCLYDAPGGSHAALPYGMDVVIVGLVEEGWYHVWCCDINQGGYMKQADFWAGNG